MSAVPACAVPGVYKLRRPQASPLFRLVSDHFRAFHHAYEERFAPTYGNWRSVVREVADKFLACGVLDHGFARVRCDACTHEYLLAFSCKARYFCPSCHAKRLAVWTLWLEDSLFVSGVPHRQVVLTIPKRLRTWCLYRRTLGIGISIGVGRLSVDHTARSPTSPAPRGGRRRAFDLARAP